MTTIIFVFYADGRFVTVSEGIENARSEEKYLLSRHNNVECLSIIGMTFDYCWIEVDKLLKSEVE